ncbi:MAG: hypothetical protein ABI091_09170 [Ferruginibacter sp.]
MKTKIISCFFGLLIFLPAIAQKTASVETETFFKKAISQINPRHVAWIKATATTIHQKNLSDADAKKMASQYGASGNMNNSTIEALTFLVMMQASKDAQDDLKSMMADAKSRNDQKKQLRDLLQNLQQNKNELSRPRLDSIKLVIKKQPAMQTVNTGKVIQPLKVVPVNTARDKQVTTVSPKVTKEEIDKAAAEIKAKQDSLSEMGETESLRLQMAMDRRSKMMENLSNMLKKMSDTQDQIIQNLK